MCVPDICCKINYQLWRYVKRKMGVVYAACIDLKKEYNRVDRKALWNVFI